MGRALAAEGRYDDAIEHYMEALRLKPELAENHHNLGSAFFAQGNFERAVEEFETALRLNPNLAVTRQNLALALEQLKMKR